jgi:ATP-dependent DNA helicase PIF1
MSNVIEGDLPEFMENTDENLFVTGKAGCGKSMALRRFIDMTTKQVIVCGPTGVSAVNIGGSTIHRTFKMPIGFLNEDEISKIAFTQGEIVRLADTLLIDEVSMVSPELLNTVDRILRKVLRGSLPFGGLQVIMFGDLYQLPPVLKGPEKAFVEKKYGSPYFFSAPGVEGVRMIELTRPFRQTDQEFLSLLNLIRDGSANQTTMDELNKRVVRNSDREGRITLSTVNRRVDQINGAELRRLSSMPRTYTAQVSGIFPKNSQPAEESLVLKPGSQVMFIKNISFPNYEDKGKGFISNGELGVVERLMPEEVHVKLSDGRVAKVGAADWDVTEPTVGATGEIKYEPIGTFTQVPLRLGFATSIHKSQGKTFDRMILDIDSGAFDTGQTYVGLSRCRSLDGLVLERPLNLKDVMIDQRVKAFMELKRESDNYTQFLQERIESS